MFRRAPARASARAPVPVLLVLLAALAGLGTAACGGGETDAIEGAAAAPSVRAALAAASRSEVPLEIELAGVVEADQTATVSTRVMATVTAVHVREGQTVRRGELLLSIDPQAAEGAVSQARGGLAQANAALSLARRNFERYEALAASDAASELELDMARMQLEQAEGAAQQARGSLSAASSVAGDSRVTAPFAGRVASRLVEVGELAAPGRPLLLIESLDARRLGVAVPESVVRRAGLAPGARVPVRVDSAPELGWFEGTVVEMTPGSAAGSHSFDVKVAIPGTTVPTGAAGRARFPVGLREAVTVPAGAVLEQGGLDLVVLRRDDGTTASRVVTVGTTLADGRVEILSGLDGGETVLVGLGALPPAGSTVEETRSGEEANL